MGQVVAADFSARNFRRVASAGVVFSAEELGLLEELGRQGRVFSVLIYMLGLRPAMDGATGIVGQKKRLSYKAFGELCERRPERGSHLSEKNRGVRQIRYDLECLVGAGLLEPMRGSDGKAVPLVFFLPKAVCALVRSDEERHDERPQSHGKKPFDSRVCDDQRALAGTAERHTSLLQQQQTPSGKDFGQFLAEVVQLYHDFFPASPRVRWLGQVELRRRFAGALALDVRFSDIEFWRWYFSERVPQSAFLSGRDYRPDLGPFRITFLSLISENILGGLLNGKFS